MSAAPERFHPTLDDATILSAEQCVWEAIRR